MPPLASQILIPEAFTADFTVARALLRQGRPFELAVKTFSPYTEIKEENPNARTALRELMVRSQRRGQARVFIRKQSVSKETPLSPSRP